MQFLDPTTLDAATKAKLINFSNRLPTLIKEIDNLLQSQGLSDLSIVKIILTQNSSKLLTKRHCEENPISAGLSVDGLLYGGDLVNNG